MNPEPEILLTRACRMPHTVIAIEIVTAPTVNAVNPMLAMRGTDIADRNPPPTMGRVTSWR